ncbi:MAG TPA: ClpXP protease specificity-enhancing factor SspB [Alphaproteobacteria bacterium]|nr:ClpXP protease specificity-enhancing factor SspB [Alphaproteobacteria bacterium]
MGKDGLRYDKMVEDALRGVVRQSLTLVAKNGFTDNHHFYLTFRTRHAGVSIPDHLRAQYPDEMTIVLQYQFWGLKVDEEKFEVTLSFNKQQERLVVPFAAMTGFVDPSVQFGLQFKGEIAAANAAPAAKVAGGAVEPAAEPSETGTAPRVVALDAFRKK